ncbi:hypothetical protein SKAU_G00116870 [Synaphobranchus kaupii]|uniref:SNTX thioredoxin-like domain-containing protein n=1 Tax=Synaphobranchus kaupii TaxID=118154 RepID=A0A9Q1J1M5_SYNKA|nr:hypothetical protein SKAU_G00116870 [Synaphobranchus kaupii]
MQTTGPKTLLLLSLRLMLLLPTVELQLQASDLQGKVYSETIQIAALGRPLHPGMLYDCLKDTFIPGIALWDQAAIQKDMKVEPQPHTHLDFSASDSFSEKTKLMDVSASLKASFLAGLVEVGGSADYLSDKMSSMKQCRVTMQYKQTTEYKQLTMTQLGHVTYPDVFDQKIATHVVTAVLYGAEAFMVFDQTASNENDKQDIKGNMDVMIKKIPSVEISGSGNVILTDEEKKKVEKFSCTFYGDYTLEQNPTSYEEAVLLYKQLPKLLGENKKEAVPVRVWLYPLKNLNPKAAQLESKISVELVFRVEAVMGQLQEAKMRANDNIRRCNAIKVTDIKDKLVKFQDKLEIYTVTLQQNLRKVLPAIRAGTEGDQKLIDILKFHDDSSFSHNKMREWLDEKESEIGVLENYINSLGSVPIVPPGPELSKVISDPKDTRIVMFTFTSLKYEEPYLTNLHECLASEEFNKMREISVAHNFIFKVEALPWFRDPEISQRMRDVLAHWQAQTFPFCGFSFFSTTINLSCKPICKPIISYISDTSYHGASMFLYIDGSLTEQNWKPVPSRVPGN